MFLLVSYYIPIIFLLYSYYIAYYIAYYVPIPDIQSSSAVVLTVPSPFDFESRIFEEYPPTPYLITPHPSLEYPPLTPI